MLPAGKFYVGLNPLAGAKQLGVVSMNFFQRSCGCLLTLILRSHPRARTLGGCSTHNAMYCTGQYQARQTSSSQISLAIFMEVRKVRLNGFLKGKANLLGFLRI